MRTGAIILASLALAAGLLGTLSLVVLLFAGAPNSSDSQLRTIYRLMALAGAGGLACLIGGVVLIIMRQPGWASLVGALPMLFLLGMIVWLVFTSSL